MGKKPLCILMLILGVSVGMKASPSSDPIDFFYDYDEPSAKTKQSYMLFSDRFSSLVAVYLLEKLRRYHFIDTHDRPVFTWREKSIEGELPFDTEPKLWVFREHILALMEQKRDDFISYHDLRAAVQRSEVSEEIWDDLTSRGYINKEGEVMTVLSPHLPISPLFRSFYPELTVIIESLNGLSQWRSPEFRVQRIGFQKYPFSESENGVLLPNGREWIGISGFYYQGPHLKQFRAGIENEWWTTGGYNLKIHYHLVKEDSRLSHLGDMGVAYRFSPSESWIVNSGLGIQILKKETTFAALKSKWDFRVFVKPVQLFLEAEYAFYASPIYELFAGMSTHIGMCELRAGYSSMVFNGIPIQGMRYGIYGWW